MPTYSEQPIEGHADLTARKARAVCKRAADLNARGILDFVNAMINEAVAKLYVVERLAAIQPAFTTADVDALLSDIVAEGDGGA